MHKYHYVFLRYRKSGKRGKCLAVNCSTGDIFSIFMGMKESTKCCGKLDGNFWNIQGTREEIRAVLKKGCYKTCGYCGKDI